MMHKPQGNFCVNASSILTSCRIVRLAYVKIPEISVVRRFKNKNDALILDMTFLINNLRCEDGNEKWLEKGKRRL